MLFWMKQYSLQAHHCRRCFSCQTVLLLTVQGLAWVHASPDTVAGTNLTALHRVEIPAWYLQCKLVDTADAFELLKTDLRMELIEQLVDVV